MSIRVSHAEVVRTDRRAYTVCLFYGDDGLDYDPFNGADFHGLRAERRAVRWATRELRRLRARENFKGTVQRVG